MSSIGYTLAWEPEADPAVRGQHHPAAVVVQPPQPALQLRHRPFGITRGRQRMVGARPEGADVPQDPDRAPLSGITPGRVQEGHQRGQHQPGEEDSHVADDHRWPDVELPDAQGHDQLPGDDAPQRVHTVYRREPWAACRRAPAPYAPLIRLSCPAHSRSRSTNFWILPVEVFGSGPNSIASGHL